jgi:hypothetical protein
MQRELLQEYEVYNISPFMCEAHANKWSEWQHWDLHKMSSMNYDVIDSMLHSNDTFWWNKMTNLMLGWWTTSVQAYLSRVELWDWIMKHRRSNSATSSGPSSGVQTSDISLSNMAINTTGPGTERHTQRYRTDTPRVCICVNGWHVRKGAGLVVSVL